MDGERAKQCRVLQLFQLGKVGDVVDVQVEGFEVFKVP
jgi:hypothetical protein